MQLAPKAATQANETLSALVTSSANFDDFDVSIDLQTIKQLRNGSAPYPSDAGWLLWHYTDEKHFYYFAPKTDGWELGKEDPSAPAGRRYLATGASPAFPVGTLQTIRVVQSGNAITVYDNGLKIVSVTDAKSPYTSGRFGLYAQDSEADFGSLKLTTPEGTTTL